MAGSHIEAALFEKRYRWKMAVAGGTGYPLPISKKD
jgi:hypothetical protein